MAKEPSLLAFVLARLDEDFGLVIANMPLMFDDSGVDPVFAERFLNRGVVVGKIRSERDLVVRCAQEMREVQGYPPHVNPHDPDGVTVLGTYVIKTIAFRYSHHPDFRSEWIAEEQ